MYYNSLVDSTFDLSSEHDVLFGCFRSYKANSGPVCFLFFFFASLEYHGGQRLPPVYA